MQIGVERDFDEVHIYVKQEMCTVCSAKWPTDEWLRTANCFLITGPLVVVNYLLYHFINSCYGDHRNCR